MPVIRRPLCWVFFAWSVASGGWLPADPGTEPRRPNILVIVGDDKYYAADREPSKCRDFGSNCSVVGDSHIASNPVKFSGIGVH